MNHKRNSYSKLLLLAAYFLSGNLFAIPQFRQTIQAANNAFSQGNYPHATQLFIKGYWELRKVLTDIWYQADPVGNHKWGSYEGFNGKYEPINIGRFKNPRGYVQESNMRLGCWLNNSLLRQNVNWYHPISNGQHGRSVFYKGKSKSNIIKKNLLKPLRKKTYAA